MTSMLLLLLGLALLASLNDAQEWHHLSLPGNYSGDTPYKGVSFGSSTVTIALRTQRDIALNVTIDQGLWPAINLKSYFGTDYSAQKLGTIENLLYMGYRRLVLDLYWDPGRSVWQVCPEAFGSLANSRTGQDVRLQTYTCAPTYTFRDFADTLQHYLITTDLYAAPYSTDLLFLILNLNPLPNGNGTTFLPDNGTRLRDIVRQAVTTTNTLYTPILLQNDRRSQRTPTDTSWPVWIELIGRGYELIVGFGTNNMPNYDLTPELDTIFPPAALGVPLSQNSQIQCPTAANQTWPFLADGQDLTINGTSLLSAFNYSTALTAVQCGYSPYFTASNYTTPNSTLNANDTGHWANMILSTIWSWDLNEPNAITNPYCAVIQRWNGRWRASDCTKLLRVSCRNMHDPNEWVLTSAYVSYDRAFLACPNGYYFDAPRTARDNLLLLNVIQADQTHNSPSDNSNTELSHNLIWINLNSGTDGSCWVVGRYSKCWWLGEDGQEFERLIRTSAAAGVIILFIVVIFTWLKCARWWRQRKASIRKHYIKRLLARREYVTVPI